MVCYDMILDELERREVAFVHMFAPYFICSVGAHIFNLRNKGDPVKIAHARAPDMRLHLMFVTPPGFGRSFFMRQFIDEWGVIGDAVPSTFESYMTQAGFVGTHVRGKDGSIQKEPGVIELFADGIVAVEEWSGMEAAMQQSHSLGLDSAILDALDKGRVTKRMSTGSFHIDTAMTLWASTQIGRFNMAGGITRRLFFMEWTPSAKDMKVLIQAYIKGRDIAFESGIVSKIAQRIGDIRVKLERLEKLEYSDELDEFFLSKGRVHYEWPLYERLVVGYKVMMEDFSKVMDFAPDATLKALLSRAMRWRDGLLAESGGEQMLQVVADAGVSGIGWNELKERMVVFASDYRTSEQMVRQLMASGLLEMDDKGSVVLTELTRKRRR